MDALLTNRNTLGRILNLTTGKSTGPGLLKKQIPIPTPSPNQVLIKVTAVALNPIDCKSADLIGPRGSILGCDYAGTISQIGSSLAAPGSWKEGDRVAGFVHGGLFGDRGSFAEYLVVDADLCWRVPEGVSDEQVCTYGISAVTAFLALSSRLDIPVPIDGVVREGGAGTVLIYSGSTAVGLFAIQLAKMSGYTVVTTASPRSSELVKRYGADFVYDYRSPTAVSTIIAAHPGITRALDCISQGVSAEFCAKVLKGSGSGGKVVTLFDMGKCKTKGVEFVSLMVFTVFGKAFAFLPPVGPKFEASAFDRDALVGFYKGLETMVEGLKTPPLKVVGKGFEKIVEGLDLLRQGKVSGEKLVVNF